MYHPNINKDSGDLCDDIYKSDWKPVSNMKKVCTIIMNMLAAPNLASPI
jgi:peroxin-4